MRSERNFLVASASAPCFCPRKLSTWFLDNFKAETSVGHTVQMWGKGEVWARGEHYVVPQVINVCCILAFTVPTSLERCCSRWLLLAVFLVSRVCQFGMRQGGQPASPESRWHAKLNDASAAPMNFPPYRLSRCLSRTESEDCERPHDGWHT